MQRNCEICLSKLNKRLYTQQFIIPGDQAEKKYGYEVVSCTECGFVYASEIMSQTELGEFYKNNLKYAYKSDRGSIPEYASWFHGKAYEFVNSNLEKILPRLDRQKLSILDIGCGGGYLLNCFKEHGYSNLHGLDPAPDCKSSANELYDIEIETATLEEYKTKDKFDLVILGSVLEHMSNLREVIKKIHKLLKPDGLFYITVPDGDNMGAVLNEPFLEFSLEHINYFTRGSMTNLLSIHGFRNVGFESLLVPQYGGYALNALWQKHDGKFKIQMDRVGEAKITKYIADSQAKMVKISNQVGALVKSQVELYVWGVGSLASRLLASTKLRKANIIALIDNNPSLQGKFVTGKRITSPAELSDKQATVLITSYIHGDAIKKDLIEKYNHVGKIITLA